MAMVLGSCNARQLLYSTVCSTARRFQSSVANTRPEGSPVENPFKLDREEEAMLLKRVGTNDEQVARQTLAQIPRRDPRSIPWSMTANSQLHIHSSEKYGGASFSLTSLKDSKEAFVNRSIYVKGANELRKKDSSWKTTLKQDGLKILQVANDLRAGHPRRDAHRWIETREEARLRKLAKKYTHGGFKAQLTVLTPEADILKSGFEILDIRSAPALWPGVIGFTTVYQVSVKVTTTQRLDVTDARGKPVKTIGPKSVTEIYALQTTPVEEKLRWKAISILTPTEDR